MTPRPNPYETAPEAMRPMRALKTGLTESGLEAPLLHLVELRVSQINGCTYCVQLHAREARRDGEDEERLHMLCVWRDSGLFTPREQAALRWAESLTLIAETHAPQADHDALAAEFTPHEQVWLTLAITTMNAWNRLSIGLRYTGPLPERIGA